MFYFCAVHATVPHAFAEQEEHWYPPDSTTVQSGKKLAHDLIVQAAHGDVMSESENVLVV